MAKIHKIIDKGFEDSVTEQLVDWFDDSGETAIYFRSTSAPEVMLVSTEPITQEAYDIWKEASEGWKSKIEKVASDCV